MAQAKTLSPLFHYDIPQKILIGEEKMRAFDRELKEEFLRILNAGKIIHLQELIHEQLKKDGYLELTPEHQKRLETWYRHVTECDYLSHLLNLSSNEWILHGADKLQCLGDLKAQNSASLSISPEDFFLSLQVFCLKNQTEWNYNHPIVSFTSTLFGHFLRLTLIHPSMTKNSQPKVFLRNLSERKLTFDDFSLDPEIQEDLIEKVRQQKNILVTGSTGSGKTSFIRLLLNHIAGQEHLITLEDTRELNPDHEFTTSLLSRGDSKNEMKELFRQALRMSPDRLILGEMRGPEALSFILAMNSGHSGLMSTIHANSARESLERVALLFHFYNTESSLSHEILIKLLSQNIDYVIHLEHKRVKEIIEIKGAEKTSPIFDVLWEEGGASENPAPFF